jgi:hypothetical protein
MTKPPYCPARLASFGYARQLNTALDDGEMEKRTAVQHSPQRAKLRLEPQPELSEIRKDRAAGDTIPALRSMRAAELRQE